MPLPSDVSQMTSSELDTQWAATEQAVADGDLTLDQTAAMLEQVFTTGTPPVLP
jgi:hypothetical protein